MCPNWHEYFMLQAKLAAVRSTCNSRPQGAVLVRGNRVIATGYNGALPSQEHCLGKTMYLEPGTDNPTPYCRRRAVHAPDARKDRACVSAHAEANAVAQAARLGTTTEGTVLYCTTRPCTPCIKLLVQAGVVRAFYELDYDDPKEQWLQELLPMEQLTVGPVETGLAIETLWPGTSRRRLGRTE